MFGLSPAVSVADSLNHYLSTGQLRAGIGHYRQPAVATHEAERLFSLGVLQFFSALEGFAQGLYTAGLDSQTGAELNLPFFRLPVPDNDDPRPVSAGDIGRVFEQFHRDLEETNTTLKRAGAALAADPGDPPLALAVDLGHIILDLNGDGRAGEEERFFNIYQTYNRGVGDPADQPFTIHFDGGDLHWLKGYTHLLLALLDSLLAYDGSQLFARAGHLLFPNAQTPLAEQLRQHASSEGQRWADWVAALHSLNFELRQPQRLESAHGHLLAMVTSSRASWRLINAERDNRGEWIPNAHQQSVTGWSIDAAMIAGWHDFLQRLEDILQGEVLIPHWRFGAGQGINLQRVFTEPRPFDLLLWIQGSAALPYLEAGQVVTPEEGRQLQRLFQGNFIGFALWIN
ncbi:MAG: hypothetical protein ACFCBW_08630 [Candidatus Competibacterales bacterium]